MNSIANITIAHVPNDRTVIAVLLEYLGLLKTRKICVMPDFKRGQLFYKAYIEVAEWCDREAAYNLIKKIKDPRKEARIVYEDDNWWAVEETAKEDLQFTQCQGFEQWTTVFDDKEQFEEQFEEQVEEQVEEQFEEQVEFDDFCIQFGLVHGYNFVAEYEAWCNDIFNEEIVKQEKMKESNQLMSCELGY
jgi:hypothetical protein